MNAHTHRNVEKQSNRKPQVLSTIPRQIHGAHFKRKQISKSEQTEKMEKQVEFQEEICQKFLNTSFKLPEVEKKEKKY